jgi:uncharacterized membrane-anchored protein YhcB (DUF1043 family)
MSITAAIIIALLVGTAIGLTIAYLKQQSRTRKLQQRFGPEYHRAVAQTGDRYAADLGEPAKESMADAAPAT